jgi:hypothetical protein
MYVPSPLHLLQRIAENWNRLSAFGEIDLFKRSVLQVFARVNNLGNEISPVQAWCQPELRGEKV